MNVDDSERLARCESPEFKPLALLFAAFALLSACGGDGRGTAPDPGVQVADAAANCAGLASTNVPASAIALPTQGATIQSAALQASGTVAGTGEFCKILGSVLSTNAADPPINFELNLPSAWNGKALQMGGGGFDGSVVTGLNVIDNAPATLPTPLANGYATFGGDGGHTGAGLDGSFGTNAQAVANYTGEAVKRTHDAAAFLINAYYKKAPAKSYFAGSSKGGHEGLVAVQRYPADYDGAIVYYPANIHTLAWYRVWDAAFNRPGGYLNPTKQALLKTKVLEACDALDGVADGIVSNPDACRSRFAVNSLRCEGGADGGDTCLSDAQIDTLVTAATPMQCAYPLAFGVTSMGPFPVFNGGDDLSFAFSSLFNPAAVDPTGTSTLYYIFNDGVIKNMIDPGSTGASFDYLAWQPKIQALSAQWDAKDPNIDAFQKKGGKLLLIQGTTDMLVAPPVTTDYYNSLKARYGDVLKDFARYYVVPGFGHGTGPFQSKWDSLSALDSWASNGTAPANQVTTDGAAATAGRTRPLCEYPLFPKYNGTGDGNSATNFTCSASQ